MSGSAVIIGASGGIGHALANAIAEEGTNSRVWRFARSGEGDGAVDLADEASIARAAVQVAEGPAPTRVIVATGMLHADGVGPEKSLKELDPEWLLRQFEINAIGPALVLKHFLPLLPRTGEPVVALLSARIGSISDNRLGGWYGYRASKAALNQIIRTAAIELKRTHDRAILVGLHPGTVDTALSRPFRGSVAPGQLFTPDRAAMQLLDVIDALKPKDSGQVFAWDGEAIAP